MRQLRDLITFLALALFVSVSVAATIQAVRKGLPVAIVDRHDELRQRLIAASVTELPDKLQNQLLRQLERELRRGVDWEQDYAALSSREQDLLVENLIDLAERWLNEKMEEYSRLPDYTEREQFLDFEIRRLKNFKGIQNGAFSVAREEPNSLVSALADSATRRFQQAGRLRQAVLMGFANAVTQRWGAQGMRELLPSGSPPGNDR